MFGLMFVFLFFGFFVYALGDFLAYIIGDLSEDQYRKFGLSVFMMVLCLAVSLYTLGGNWPPTASCADFPVFCSMAISAGF